MVRLAGGSAMRPRQLREACDALHNRLSWKVVLATVILCCGLVATATYESSHTHLGIQDAVKTSQHRRKSKAFLQGLRGTPHDSLGNDAPTRPILAEMGHSGVNATSEVHDASIQPHTTPGGNRSPMGEAAGLERAQPAAPIFVAMNAAADPEAAPLQTGPILVPTADMSAAIATALPSAPLAGAPPTAAGSAATQSEQPVLKTAGGAAVSVAAAPVAAAPLTPLPIAAAPIAAVPQPAATAAAIPITAVPVVAGPAAAQPAADTPVTAPPAAATTIAERPIAAAPLPAAPLAAVPVTAPPPTAAPAAAPPPAATPAAAAPTTAPSAAAAPTTAPSAAAAPTTAPSTAAATAATIPIIAVPAAAGSAAAQSAAAPPAAAPTAAAPSAAAPSAAASPTPAPPAAATEPPAAKPSTAAAPTATPAAAQPASAPVTTAPVPISPTTGVPLAPVPAAAQPTATPTDSGAAEAKDTGDISGDAGITAAPEAQAPKTISHYIRPVQVADEFVADKGFCVSACTCWPVWSSSIVVLIVYGCATFVAILLSASLFSKGIVSSSFLKGGGYWLFAAASLGIVLGSLIGGFVSGCVAGGLALGAGMMALFTSLPLVGKRGAWLGAMGGLLTGAVIGILTQLGALAIGLGAAIGILLGLVVGFAPIARELKMNERYIRRGIAGPQSIRSTDGPNKNYSTGYQHGGDVRASFERNASGGLQERATPSQRSFSRSIRTRSFLSDDQRAARLRSHSMTASDSGLHSEGR